MIISRRHVLKTSAAASTLLAAPAVLRGPAFGQSSGTVDVFAWGDYVQPNMIEKFEKDTGIKVNLSTYGSNDEAAQKLKAAGGKGFDVAFPSITNVANYVSDSGELLVQEIDETKANVGAVIPSMYRDSIQLGGVQNGARVAIPFNWGTEAITFDSEVHPLSDDEVSFGQLWSDAAKGHAAFRQKSVLIGTGLYLDAAGKIQSNRMLDVYKTEDDYRRVMDEVAKFIIDNSDSFGAFWNNATEATNAFTQAGCTIGQTWDTTGILLNRDNAKYKYRMPVEGGMTWMDSMVIPSGAANLEQAYAFVNAMLDPQMGGLLVANTGYNSCVDGAAKFAGDAYARQFSEIYDAENLANLWWWQADTPFFATLTQQYVDRITNAA